MVVSSAGCLRPCGGRRDPWARRAGRFPTTCSMPPLVGRARRRQRPGPELSRALITSHHGREIWRVDVAPATGPVWTKTSKTDRIFYVRLNSSTRALPDDDEITPTLPSGGHNEAPAHYPAVSALALVPNSYPRYPIDAAPRNRLTPERRVGQIPAIGRSRSARPVSASRRFESSC